MSFLLRVQRTEDTDKCTGGPPNTSNLERLLPSTMECHVFSIRVSFVDWLATQTDASLILASLLALSLTMSTACAATARPTCVLPVPDGGDGPPSKANAEGRTVRVGHGFIEVARRSGQPMHIGYTDKTEFYSAFGGDYDPSELAPGQHVAVWFVGCKLSADGSGQAAYLQLYSKDPSDQPPG